jgi:hypothetical protein
MISTCTIRFADAPTTPAAHLASWTAKRWSPGATIRVAFLDGTAEQKAAVRRHAATWSQYAAIAFAFDSDPATAEVRVAFPGDYGDYWSAIGTDCKDRTSFPAETVHLAFPPGTADDEYRRVIVHEFGHVLGFVHEHQSPAETIPWNRPAVYAWYGQTQGWSPQMIDQQVLMPLSSLDIRDFSPWDKGSIMEYPIPAELVTDPSYAVGWNSTLSPTDIARAALWYPGPTTVPPPGQPPVTPPPVRPPEPQTFALNPVSRMGAYTITVPLSEPATVALSVKGLRLVVKAVVGSPPGASLRAFLLPGISYAVTVTPTAGRLVAVKSAGMEAVA